MILTGLRTRSFLFFAALGIVVSLIVGFTIYFKYAQQLKHNYMSTMEKVSQVLEAQFPVLADPDYLEQQGRADSKEYWAVQHSFQNMADAFNMHIHLEKKVGDKLQIIIGAHSDHIVAYSPEEIFSKLHVESYAYPLILLVYETKAMQVSKKPYTNEYGTVVSLFRPIIKDGNVAAIIELDYDISFVKQLQWQVTFTLLIALGLAVVLASVFALFLSGSLTSPIAELANYARRIGSGDLEGKITIKGKDEIAELGTIFNKMTTDIKEHIHNLNKVTAEKERINSELRIASDIQNDMLPRIFPTFSNHKWFSVFAKMETAKEVGGDFFDFFFLDKKETKLVLVIADVSGKGVPAALFMVIAKTLIKQQMMHYGDPAAALDHVNRMLCKDNPRSMFVTVFLCSVDLATGQALYANGGHNPPLLSRQETAVSNTPYQFIQVKKGVPLGMFEKSRYKLSFLQLNTGDKLYLYTDGINEAMNARDEQFGNDRFLEAANKFINLSNQEFDEAIRNTVNIFVEGSEQSDDITTLAMCYRGQGFQYEREITLNADVTELDKLLDWISKAMETHDCHGKICNQIAVITEELFINTASYAYKDKGGAGDVTIRFRFEGNIIIMQFKDSGIAFNPLEQKMPDTTASVEDREIGGLGIFITRKWVDDITYKRENNKNILTIYKSTLKGEKDGNN